MKRLKVYIWDEVIEGWENLGASTSGNFTFHEFKALSPNKDVMSIKYQLRQLQKYGLVEKNKRKLRKHRVDAHGQEVAEVAVRKYRKVYNVLDDWFKKWFSDYVSKIPIHITALPQSKSEIESAGQLIQT